jgi:alcohol dehydrogenase class IV
MAEKRGLRFRFHNPGRIVFGEGSAGRAGRELAGLGASRACLVTDSGLFDSEMVKTVKASLGEMLACVFDTAHELVNRGAALAMEAGADSVVSVGGGSSMDTAKAVAVLLARKETDIRPYIGLFKVGAKVVPHIAIPTTAGTGSECTYVSVIKDRERNVKELLVDNSIIPPLAILDPEMTVSMPPGLTAGTGMDAITHAIEAMVSANHMPPADAFASHAIALLVENIPRAYKDGSDINARSMNLIAASEAGMAFQNALVGVVHAMAHALGGQFGVPHGLANALLLAEGMTYNLEAATDRLALVARAMGIAPTGDDMKDAKAGIERVRSLTRELEIPQKLSEVGVREDGLEECAKLALADGSMLTNPRRPAGPEEIIEVYRRIL